MAKKKQKTLGADERGWFRITPGPDGPQRREIPSLGVRLVGGDEELGSAVVELTGAQVRDLTQCGLDVEPTEAPEPAADPRSEFLGKGRGSKVADTTNAKADDSASKEGA